jgi:mannose/fructose-specific phosphotransferase system component IIA
VTAPGTNEPHAAAAEPLGGVIVTHGELGAALLDAAARIAGPSVGVVALSNTGRSRDALIEAVRREVAKLGPRGGLILTDVTGGSCTQAALFVAAREAVGPVHVVTGVNLPMLLDFLHNRGTCEPKALAERLVARGQASIGVVQAPASAGGTKA